MPSAEFLADFHIHSRYSRATSRDLTIDNLHKAALLKGVTVVGIGDFTHPGWMQEIREKLVPAEEGLFRLRDELAREAARQIPASCAGEVRFILTAEISSIYKKHDRVRKVHDLLFAPGLDEALGISGRLERIGNIASDGRPILGLDARELLAILLDVSPSCFLVPAHIWTPWFSVLGSSSGFDSIEECFEDLSPEIFALETGLSSDPAMNWRLSALDRFSLMSNSDAHSPDRLGREANRFACELSFQGIRSALRQGGGGHFLGTVEFFPEQGKYHFDGHRKCGCRLHPAETLRRNCLCPVCGKKVTVGVMHRVELLADRPEGARAAAALPYDRLISLAEAAGEAQGQGPGSKGVQNLCSKLVRELGPELAILTRVPLEEIRHAGGDLLAEGIRRMRAAEVVTEEGYDGEFGVVRLFRPEERRELEGQSSLLADSDLLVHAGDAPIRKRGRRKQTESRGHPGEAGGAGDDTSPSVGSPLAPEVDRGSSGAGPGESSDEDFAWGAPPGSAAPPGAGSPRDSASAVASPAGASGAAKRSAWSASLLERLNPEQREAVLAFGAPLLLIAGPGTGKTLTLTYRIAYLVRELGLPAEQVLAVTFTQRAAREMEGRLTALLGEQPGESAVRVRTFHALGAEILREAGPARGVLFDFRILGDEDQLRLLKRAVPSLSHREAEALLERISIAKRNILYPDAADKDLGRPSIARRDAPHSGAAREGLADPIIAGRNVSCSETARDDFADPGFVQAYRAYEQALAEYRCLDFDDLVARAVLTLETHRDFSREVQGRIAAVSVDEYQDVNYAQYRLLRSLATAARDLCVIGDPDQAIYGFRGASARYFLDFERDYPGGRSLRLVRNYRSTEPILAGSSGMLSAGRSTRGAPTLVATLGDGPRIREAELASEKAEAIFIAQAIESLLGGTDSLSLYAGKVADEGERLCTGFADIAVLYRLKALAPGLEEALRYQGIPFQGASHADAWQGREGRSLVALLQWLRDPGDRLAWESILAHGTGTAEDLRAALERYRSQRLQAGCPLKECILGLPELKTFPFQESPWKEMRETLLRAAMAYGPNDWDPFLRSLVLSRAPDFLDRKSERVTLATLHAAKGLEFPVVFIAGCEEKLLPCRLGVEASDPEEERRLFYVGMTRACRLVFLTRARSRLLYGERQENNPSPFLGDVPPGTIEKVRLPQLGRKKKSGCEQPLLFKMPDD